MKDRPFSQKSILSYLICITVIGISNLVSCGQINGWDIIVDYSNRNLISQYTFVFTLQTPLDSSDLIQITMPYAIQTSVNANIAVGLTATLGPISYSTCSANDTLTTTNPSQYINPSAQQAVTIFAQTASSTVYQFQLYASLQAGVEYALILQSNNQPVSQPVGITNYISMVTISGQSFGGNPIIYDRNDLFSAFALSDNAASNLVIGYQVDSSIQNNFQAQYQVFVDIMNNVNGQGGSLYEIKFGQGNSSPFSFVSKNDGTLTSLCQSVGKQTNAYVVNALPADQYSCIVQNNLVSIQVYPTLLQDSRLRFAIYVANPIYAFSAGENLVVSRLKINTRNVLEMGQSPKFLYVQGIQLLSSSMKIGWGLDETVTPAPNQVMPIFTNAATVGTASTYNSIQFQFSLQTSTPAGLQVQLTFNVGTSTSATPNQATVLQGSIIHNFPEIPGTSRTECGILNDGPTRVIKCFNVGQMIAKQNYFIGFKIMFVNGATIGPDFSKVSIFLLNPNNNMLPFTDAIVQNQVITKTSSIVLVPNKSYFLAGSESTAISSQVITNQANAVYNPFSDATNGILGIVPEKTYNTPQKLIFCMQLTPTDITNINDAASPPTSQRAGYYLVTNSRVIQFQQKGLAIDQYGNLQSSQVISSNTNLAADQYQSLELGQYSRLKVQTSKMADIANMFSGGMIFAIRTVFVRMHASLYADDNSLDFYFFFYDNIQNYQPQFKFAIIYNAYTINTPKPKNLRYSLVNFYGGLNSNNDGTNVPTFIRLAGYLSSTDFTDGNQRLFVFFTGLNFFSDSPTTINYSTQCTSSVGATPTLCRGFNNLNQQTQNIYQNYNFMQRVEVQFPTTVPTGSGSPFELLIPVQTITGITQVTLFIATMKYQEMIPTSPLEQAAMKNYFFQPSTVFRLTGSNNLQDTTQFISFQQLQANTVPLTNNYMLTGILRIDSYGMNLQNNYVGQLAPQISINARHTETTTVVGTNTGSSDTPQNGAGFTFVTSYDFRGAQQNYYWQGGLPSNIRKCLSFQYNQNQGSSTQNWRYGFFCAMEVGTTATVSQVNVTNFQLPQTLGLYLPSSTSFAYSTSNGQIATLLYQQQNIGNPNEIQVTLNTASPTIRLWAKNIRIVWTFTTTNPLPSNGYVKIVFKDPITLIGLATTTCKFQTSIPHNCIVSQPTGQNQVILFQFQSLSSGTNILPGGFMQIFHYGNDAPTQPQSNNLFLIQTMTKDQVLIDQTQASLQYPSYLNYNNLATQKPLILIDGYLDIDYPYYSAESTVRISFNTNDQRGLLQSEIIQVNFNSDLAAANINTVNLQIQCQIWQGGSVSNYFSFATIANTAANNFKVSFQVKKDISYSGSNYFTVICRNIILPSSSFTNSPSIALYKSDGTTIIQLPATLTIPNMQASAKATTPVTLSKSNFNTYGSICTLTFSFVANSVTQGTNFFLIRFANAYLPQLVQDASLQCLINSQISPCSISSPYNLIISNVPTNLSTFSVSIAGVQLPSIASPDPNLNTFFISLVNQQNNVGQQLVPVTYSSVNDIASNIQPNNNFFITGIQLANTNVQQQNTLTFNFTFPIGFFTQGTAYQFYITFPSQWKYLLQFYTPQITLRRINTNQFLKLTTTVSTFITLALTWSDVANTAVEPFTLVLSNIANPQNPLCILPKQWVFHVQSGTGTQTLYARSVAINNQIPYFKFNYHQSTLVLNWKYPDTSNTFTVNKGPFKTLITLNIVNNQRFQYPLKIALKDDSLFGIIPQRPFAAPGASQLSFYIYAKTQTPTSNYVVYFLKSYDNFNSYSTIPICNVNLVQIQQNIVFSNANTPFYVPKNGYSNPLIVSFQQQGFVITQDVSVTLTVLQSSTYDISVVNSSGTLSATATKTISSSNTNQSIVFKFQAGLNSIVGTQVYVQLTVNSNNNYFGLPQNLLLEVNQISYSGVQFRMLSPQLDQVNSTFVLYRPYCPQYGVIYYKVELTNVYSLSTTTTTTQPQSYYDQLRAEIISRAETFYNFQSNTQQQLQYGFALSNPNAQYTQILISNLMSSKNYTISSICLNNFNQQSVNILSYQITTANNGGIITKIPLTFNTPIDLPNKIKLACYISTFLHIPPTSVYTDDRVTCDNYLNQYDFGNSQGNIANVKQNPRSSLTIYFIPDWNSPQDYVTQILLSAVQVQTFVFSLKKFITDYSNYYFTEWDLNLPQSSLSYPFTGLSQVGTLSQVQKTTQYPTINEQYYIDVNQVSSTLNITQIRITANGFLYVGLDNQLTDTTQQSAFDSYTSYSLIQGKNYQSKDMPYGVQISFTNSTKYSQFLFNNLNGNQFQLYMAVSEEDPSPYAMKSTLRKTKVYGFQTQIISSNLLTHFLFLLIGLIIVY
ncbi:transmembrane protein, putative (macronuclear) [Tetrahymena thermophila SB210]|uniref:Transmembrane protein, putative n=1 Tax=Tetrahymena thermophila (strain SB210) TaxID=312017 RepID=Q24DN0_TETTS|nr:transmembrane protein, putative [Tetrahymena thermophila SB210]EAS05883.1 transmembrane protein, putative [Tetrahymena thermophila SB210]|eukprot:XP_001026128.1 transmembrane protein, putative [Tetrahymena thermophila SB210]